MQWNKLEDATAVGFKMGGIRWGKVRESMSDCLTQNLEQNYRWVGLTELES
jgi:hypothetical protein